MPFLKLCKDKVQDKDIVAVVPPTPAIPSGQIYFNFDGDGNSNTTHSTGNNNKAKGTAYEQYIGSLYEKKGYEVDYNGINKNANDLSRDLICRVKIYHNSTTGKSPKYYTVIVQCKCYYSPSSIKNLTVLEIYKFYGSVRHYAIQHSQEVVHAVFCTNFDMRTNCYEVLKAAIELGIEVYQEVFIPKNTTTGVSTQN